MSSPPLQKTPPPKPSNERKLPADTPRRPPLATNADYQSDNLDKRRDAVLKEIGDSIPEVSIAFFLDSVLPPISPGDIDKVETSLRRGGHLPKSGGWKAFPKAPSEMTEREDAVFAPLDSIWKNVVKFASRENVLDRSPTLDFGQYPNDTPVSDGDDLARPDGWCALADEETIQMLEDLGIAYSHYSNVVLWEFKKNSTPRDFFDNIRKVVWSCHQTLLTDPRRRFVTGITIEDTSMRAWYFSRTDIMATECFDFFEKPRTFIHLMMALAFATPEELGFDTTMSLCAEPDPENPEFQVIQFKMQVNNKTYVTCGPLTDYSAHSIRGRAIRVWEAKEEDNPDVHCVVKDVWILRNSLPEGTQLRSLYALLENIPASSDGRKPTDYFLSLLDDEFVKVEDGRDDDTSVIMMRNQELPADTGHLQLIVPTAPPRAQSRPSCRSRATRMRGSDTFTLRSKPTGLPLSVPARIQFSHTKYGPRKHYRLVFQGVGLTLYNVPSLSGFLRALADATAALKILHDNGFVHRDVSPGNILLIDGKGKLSDLEYVKFVGDGEATQDLEGITDEPAEHKTGNQKFTALEVQTSNYLFAHYSPITGERLAPSFSYNHLHDLESIMWIMLWILSHCTVADQLIPEQHKIAVTFFDGEPSKRDVGLDANTRPFLTSDFPGAFTPAVEALDEIRSVLILEYIRFEAAFAENPASSTRTRDVDNIHGKLIEIQREAADLVDSELGGVLFYSEADEVSECEEEPVMKKVRT
ncbi:hypothetical protein DFH06DRAFT_746110 [Mycena polygramma]|nr:hypothetical protein DFH06DRAFT_746110 [Mycena polygramma]